MFSTGDSSGDGLSGINQFAGMGGAIDWAAMAQQWIQMHDAGNFMPMPDAPPPPNISSAIHSMNMSNNNNVTSNIPTTATAKNSAEVKNTSAIVPDITTTIKRTFEEKGEADMDMDEDEMNAARSANNDSPPPPAPSMRLGKPPSQQQPWYMRQQTTAGINLPLTDVLTGTGIGNNINQGISAAPTAPQWGATVWPPPVNLPPPAAAALMNVPLSMPTQNQTAHIPSLLKINVPNPNTTRMLTPQTVDQRAEASLVDAKQRKMLPAWIREGLEKMEREKQKQLEREKSLRREEPDSSDISSITGDIGAATNPALTVNMNYTQHAEYDRSGNDDQREETSDFDSLSVTTAALTQKQSFHEVGSGGESDLDEEDESDHEKTVNTRTQMSNKSYEDRLSDLMIVVRTTLTELLLEVTNKEIASLAQEAINAQKAKASSAQVIRKSALSSIAGKLGLAAYDDSTGDEISDSENEERSESDHIDSEEEIKASIRTKRRAFAKITSEIEERIAASAAREEQKLKYYTMMEKQEQEQQEQEQENDDAAGEYGRRDEKPTSSSASNGQGTVSKAYEKDFGETTETKLQNSNGKRQKDRSSRKERTTRFSDNKDTRGIAVAAAANYLINMHSSNLSGSSNISAPFAISTASTANNTVTVPTGMGIAVSPLGHKMPNSIEISHSNSAHGETYADLGNSSVSALNKNLMNAADAVFEQAIKSQRASSSRSSASRSERDRSRRSSYYDEDHRDYKRERYRESEYERDRKRDRDRERDRHSRDRERDRHDRRYDDRSERREDSQRHTHKNKHSAGVADVEDDDDVVIVEKSQTSSSDSESTSSSSTSTATTSTHRSSHYSRTSAKPKTRHEKSEYSRHERREERYERHRERRGSRDRRERSRSKSRSRQRSDYDRRHGSSYRHSSADDDYDNESGGYRHSSSRHGSSKKRSRSRSRSTYSSSSRRHRH